MGEKCRARVAAVFHAFNRNLPVIVPAPILNSTSEMAIRKKRGIQFIWQLWTSLAAMIAGPMDAEDFTYQGRLMDQGAPANGVYQAQFQLFDAATNGTAQGQTVTNLL